MSKTLSHTFSFKTLSEDLPLKNIIYISEEDSTKHYVQYVQYQESDKNSISLRHINLKVDRSYYLEMANICLDDRERRRHLFATLGKRRFGASSKHFDAYLVDTTLAEEEMFAKYINNYAYSSFEPYYVEKTEYSTNKFRIFIESIGTHSLLFLDQLNITPRKKVHKIFCVELTPKELLFYQSIENKKKKVNYAFNKIGKIYFKSLEQTQLQVNSKFPSTELLAHSAIITSSNEMEQSSRLNDNTSYRKLQDRLSNSAPLGVQLHKAAQELIHEPTLSSSSENFNQALSDFSIQTKGISGFKELSEHLESIYELSQAETISYLLSKNDQDLQDIFLYLLEAFSTWNEYFYAEDEDIKAFNRSTIDLVDALRYFIDVCYRFNHEYKCLDSKEKSEAVTLEEVVVAEEVCTSAQNYFSDIDIDLEVYDELLDLEHDIESINYSNTYTDEINSALICFFEGYTRVLNPLFEFKDLSYSLMLLGNKLQEYTIDENSGMLLVLMRGLLSDLAEWKRAVLIEKTAEDIHYMDKSFYSNIAQIEMSLEPSVIPEDDGDMEFF